MVTDTTAEWYWEGNVVNAIVLHLRQNGWHIVSAADTRSKERGPDIHATNNGNVLLVEVKGFPSIVYRDPRRAGEIKPTNPANQAQHWYSHAILKALRLQHSYPEAVIALGLPDFPRYRSLFNQTQWAFDKLGIALLTVDPSGNVALQGITQLTGLQPLSRDASSACSNIDN
jgi:hypothetical protein